MIQAMEETRLSLGDGRKVCQPAEEVNLVPSRRGLYAAKALPAGTRIGLDDVVTLRPATSLPPWKLASLIGCVVGRSIPAGAPFEPGDLRLERAS
jgi:sialic acid synthase SpsE